MKMTFKVNHFMKINSFTKKSILASQ